MKRFATAIVLAFCLAVASAGGDSQTDAHGEDGTGHHGNDMVVHVTYNEIYEILVFLIAAYVAGLVTKSLGMPALVGEIVTGFLLGPPLADFVPYPEALVLIGEIGLIFLILEAGIELDVAQLQQTGLRALSIAFSGSALALCVGFGIAKSIGKDFKGSLAIGAAFAPTSLGVAASALGSGGMLNTPVGQLIVASCVFDDIIGLVILSMFEVLVKKDPAMIEYFIPIISSLGSLLILGIPAITFLPVLIETKFLPKFAKKNRDMAMFFLLTAFCMGYLPLMYYTKASYLTGAFLAGATFSQVHHAHHTFMKSTHDVMSWLLRVFFAASIGFQVPVTLFAEAYVIKIGFALWASCVLIKFLVVAFVPSFENVEKGSIYNPYRRDLFVTGLSMTCRGEFSFIIAAFALSKGVIDDKMYGAVVLAVLLSAITSPFLLMKTIFRYKSLQEEHLKATNPENSDGGDGKVPLFLHIHLETEGAWGLLDKLRNQMPNLNLKVEDFRTTHQRGLNAIFTNDIYVRDDNIRVPIVSFKSMKEKDEVMNRVSSSQHLLDLVQEMSFHEENSVSFSKDSSRGSEGVLNHLSDGEKADVAIAREELKSEMAIESKIESIQMTLQDNLESFNIQSLTVAQYNPWDWTSALDTMNLKRPNGEAADMDFFLNLFHFIDADGSGMLDEDEIFHALKDAGMNVTKEGLSAMIAVVDENGDGQVSLAEWEDAVSHYLEMKSKSSKSIGRMSMKELVKTKDSEDEETGKFEDKPSHDGNAPRDSEYFQVVG